MVTGSLSSHAMIKSPVVFGTVAVEVMEYDDDT
jgi:hypothetical protein